LKKKNVVIVGATSAIAEHCARHWADEGGHDFVLVARDTEKVERVAADLQVRNPGATVMTRIVDFAAPLAIAGLADELGRARPVDVVLIAHGLLPDQALCQQDLKKCNEALSINAISPVLFAEAFAGAMERSGTGTLALIGSVAGDRGRKSNYVYGAAKGLLTRYAQGLQHRFAATRIKVVLIKPGPTATPMTAHLAGKFADASSVARRIVDGIAAGRPVIYAPARWALIMLIIRHLPRFVFNRLDI